jgi:hypothetical protein
MYTFHVSRRFQSSPAAKGILAQIHGIQPFTEGSLTVTTKRCGNPKCRCAHEGPLHETALLTWKESGKTRSLYVPQALREEVARWIEQARRLKLLTRQMSEAQRELLVRLRKSTST